MNKSGTDSAPGAAFSIDEFCRRNGGFSRSTFYKLIEQGRAPRLMRVSANRIAISPEAEAEWRSAREQDEAFGQVRPVAAEV